MSDEQAIKEEVRKRYADRALRARQASGGGCCGGPEDAVSSELYTGEEAGQVPLQAVAASAGCGNPVAMADLHEGETVLDLGSGGGIDVLLSARRVGPSGKAYGLDMTDEMLELARENARQAGATNVEFLKGEMEAMPLPDSHVDVIISNCVVNLSPDKDKVFGEAFRVLKPAGRLAIADIVARREMPAALKRSLELWAGCIAGALVEDDYRAKLTAAGFEDVEIESVREYTAAEAEAMGLGDQLRESGQKAGEPLGIFSAIVRATKPGGEPRAARRPAAVPAGAARAAGEEQIDVLPSTPRGCC